ncbi:MAG: hypothetical protein RL716_837 [Actinomycetota bacterium]|jgi:6-phosphogluconolactonase|uniref:6-phosphogluconolactonase n=1 Tax=Rhodoluna sp. TaxID=1969481 RepID=UPI0025F5B19A|nr:6-phosphogluconolactonase [Rhodoluna sp.]
MLRPFVTRSPNAQAVVEAISSDFINRANELLAEKTEIHVMLTGGTIGIATLAALGSDELKNKVDYSRVHFWWGDERFVPKSHEDRNAIQARKAFLSKIALDETKVHEFPASDEGLSLDEAAAQFAKKLAEQSPHFDLAFVGMGPDGHICSLFPGKAAPISGEAIIAEHDSPKPPPARLSFSYEAMNSVDELWFVVAGADKQDAVSVAFGDSPEDLPVGRVKGAKATRWYLDSTAATKVFGC